MKVCGIDPGVRGGAAIVELVDGAAPQLVDVTDIPVIGVEAKERIDVLALRAWIMTHQPQHVYVERSGSMPQQGVSSTFKYARAVGSIEAILACCEIPMTIVEVHGLRSAGKEASRQRVLQLFPAARAFFCHKNHGRAEASLIALMGAKGAALTDVPK